MSESRSPSLLQRHYRWTLGFWKWRCCWLLVRQLPEPDTALDDPALSVDDLIRWSVSWSKGRLSPADIRALLTNADLPWARLVRFGAANYHYGRLVLAREALASVRSAAASSRSTGLEMPELDLPDLPDANRQT
jgi:hypothetical protein